MQTSVTGITVITWRMGGTVGGTVYICISFKSHLKQYQLHNYGLSTGLIVVKYQRYLTQLSTHYNQEFFFNLLTNSFLHKSPAKYLIVCKQLERQTQTLLFYDQSEKSPDSRLQADDLWSNFIRPSFFSFSQLLKRTLDRRLIAHVWTKSLWGIFR